MVTPTTRTIHLPDAIFTEILARLPLRSISRFKSVSKTWKSTIESVYFRRLFASLHKNSSSSWSLMGYGEELVGFHGCKTWDLPKPLSFYIPLALVHFVAVAPFSNGLVMIQKFDHTCCFVGNPVLQKWYQIPPSPDASSGAFGLVTRVDEDGFVLGFKVVRLASMRATNNYVPSSLSVFLYSSETGLWSSKIIHCPYQITNQRSLNLYGTIYFSHLSEPGLLAAYDFYSEEISDHFRVIPLPDRHLNYDFNDRFKGALTTSGGFVMYIRTLAQSSSNVFKAWRLNNDDDSWQLLWETGLLHDYVPMAMHPFHSNIAYLWSQENRHLVSCNLRTHSNRDAYNDDDDHHQDCILNQSLCEEVMDDICRLRMLVGLYQFVLPQWMELVPCPPQVEMIDTTSLLSYITSMQEIKERAYITAMQEAEERIIDKYSSLWFQ